MRNQHVEDVVIVGGGTAGWVAASVLAQHFGGMIRIRLIESDEIGTVGVGEATIPQIHHLNRFLKIDEHDFLRRTNGTYKLGIEFVDWDVLGQRYLHAFGEVGINLSKTHFHHYWLRSRQLGNPCGFWDYSLHQEAALHAKFGKIDRVGTTSMTGLAYAYHFDASLYAQYLRNLAEAKGVSRIEGRIVDVKLKSETGFIDQLVLDSGEIVSGELFIDCSGFRSLLMGGALDVKYRDWSHWLPMDRAWAVPCESTEPLLPLTRATARDAGWQWRIPLQSRIGNGHVFASQFIEEDVACDQLLSSLDGNALGDPRLIRFQTGRREKFWHKNCVALGLASGFMEPLESTSIHLVQSNVDRLLKYFPTKEFPTVDIEEYNRQTIREFELIRDFLILHYVQGDRQDTPFWAYVRHMDYPDTLRHRIELFTENARLADEPSDLFRDTNWLQVMLGQGIVPRGYSPDADRIEENQLKEFMGNVRLIVENAIEPLSSHQHYISQHCSASR